jgi:hypothetical protein
MSIKTFFIIIGLIILSLTLFGCDGIDVISPPGGSTITYNNNITNNINLSNPYTNVINSTNAIITSNYILSNHFKINDNINGTGDINTSGTFNIFNSTGQYLLYNDLTNNYINYTLVGRFNATSFAGKGAQITNLVATNIASGTLAVARGGTGVTTATGTTVAVLRNNPTLFNITLNGTNNKILGNMNVSGNLTFRNAHGTYSSTQTQIMTNANTPYYISFNITEHQYLIQKSSDNINFTFNEDGEYFILISAMCTVNTPNNHIEIWFEKDGINIPRSNTKMALTSANLEIPLVVQIETTFNKTNILRLKMASDVAGSRLIYTTNTTYSPESPSIIMNIYKISMPQ